VRLGVQLAATSLMAQLTLACAPGGDVGGLPEAKEAGVAGSREGGASSTDSGAPSGRDAVEPPSCAFSATGTSSCGASGESCCTSIEVPSGTYDRTYSFGDAGATNPADPASVSTFRLDKYLVTVGRFRQFVKYLTGTAGAPPADGSGIHRHLNAGRGLADSGSAGSFETGWNAVGWGSEIPTGPGAASTWDYNLTDCLSSSTWTNPAGTAEDLPITCVNWFEAYAFCIWDGGFLPSEAEWEYVAAGGGQQRLYPWGSTDPGTSNEYAIYDCNYDVDAGDDCAGAPNIAPVGTATLGAALWSQLDMAGELFEWNLDWSAPYVDPCIDCAYLTSTQSFTDRVTRGGCYGGITSSLQAANRGLLEDPTDHDSVIGFRCARSP